MELIGSCVTTICHFHFLWEPFQRRCCLLVNYQRNLHGLVEKLKTLEACRDDIDKAVAAAVSRGTVTIKSEVEDWIKRANKLSDRLSRLEADVNANRGCIISGCCSDLRSRYKLSYEAKEKISIIDKLVSEGSAFVDHVSIPDPVAAPKFTRSASMTHFQLFTSTKVAINKVMEGLLDRKIRVVSVYGMGGVGKTTMLKKIQEEVVNQKLFNHVMMATVSQNPDLKSIQGQIADGLGFSLGGIAESLEGRANRLREFIMQEKRVLIILDDLWRTIKLGEIGIPDVEASESKILFATRDEEICHAMESQAPRAKAIINLDLLSEADSWRLFERTSGTTLESEEFEAVGKRVASECGGLPIALVAVARALAGKSMEEWKKAAARLERSKHVDHSETVFECIKLSYDFLRKKEFKEYFLMCCLFPEDHNIDKEELARYMMGLGYLSRNSNSMEEERDYASTIAEKLVDVGLLLKGEKDGQVIMHDVIRDVAIQMTSEPSGNDFQRVFMVEAGRPVKYWSARNHCECYNAISLMSCQIQTLPDCPDCPKLETLLLQENNNLKEIPSTFFERMDALRVLALSGFQDSALPPSIGHLLNLRSLFLEHCTSIEDVSIVGRLKKLEILSLKESPIEALPEDFGELSNLRILDITMCTNICIIPRGLISKLSCLEELYLKGSFGMWENDANNEGRNACFSELINLPRLNILRVDVEDSQCLPQNITPDKINWVKFDISICGKSFSRLINALLSKLPRVDSRILALDITMGHLPNWFIEALSKEAQNLTYKDCTDLNIIEEYDQGRLFGLKSLIIEKSSVTNPLISLVDGTRSTPVFESLENFRIQYIDFITEICTAGELPSRSFEKLKLLEVHQCIDLTNSLLPSSMIRRITNLEKLHANGNSSIKEIFGFEGLEAGQLYLGKLEDLRLDNLAELTNIWKGPIQFAKFSNLKFVTATKCDKLMSLFSQSMVQGLVQLEDLWVEDCLKIEEIIEQNRGIAADKITLPKLKTLALQNLDALCSFYWGDLECPSLELLYVRGCPRFGTATHEFNSSKQVLENDEQNMRLLRKRMEERLQN